MSKTSNLIAFMLGIGVGSFATWQLVKGYYSQLAEEEINSVKEVYSARKAADSETRKEMAERARQKPDIGEYAGIVEKMGYGHTDYTRPAATEEADQEETGNSPYVISPDEFGEKEGYEKISLTYYADGVLTDEDDSPVRDAEELVGDALQHFGEYEDDSVFVRDDALKCDYEILRDNREFQTEILPGQPTP